ncbi:MFS transporter [Cohnella massiliensis]|uniref:MFS transporter n=1 Tax=Cohnella massiliensis TaxID=1816691 RepID=UPI0009BB1F98|nr:MFS transporter [Cohnella massiliensis]
MKSDKLIYTLAFTMILSSMSATMFNIVLPKMAAEFQLTYAQVSWVSAIYSLIYAIGSAIYSKLADLIKLKSLVTFGILFFCIGSLIGLVSGAFWMVLLGRILQACGAAVIPAMAMIVPIRFFAERRGWALGITATGLAIGGTIGPVVSATLVSFAHWRWLFCLPLLLVVTLPFYRKYLNDEQGKGGKLDWIGGGLLACTVAGLLLTLTFENGLSAAMSAAALLLFVVRIHKATSPFVNPSLFRNVDYSLGLAIAVMGVSVGYCLLLLTPQLLADVHDLSPGLIGFIMVPGAAVSALLGRKAGKLADAKGNSTLLAIASVLLFVCFSLMYLFSLGGSPVLVAVFLIFGNVGLMFFQIALSNTISRTLPNEQTGIGMGLLSMLNFLSGAIATGIYSKIVDHGASFSLNPFVEEKNSYVYGNIYFVLTLAVLGIWIVYRVRFGSRTGERG